MGNTGAISVEEGKTLKHEVEFVKGLKFDRGYMSPFFVNNQKSSTCEMESPYILLINKKISTLQEVFKFLEFAHQKNKHLLIVAEDIESEALGTLILNKLKGSIRICTVKSPGFGDNRTSQLNDMAILTGAELVDPDLGMKLEECDVNILGSAKRVVVTKDDTIIIDGQGDKDKIRERVDSIKTQLDQASSEYDREKLQERKAKLSSGVGVIKVGGATEVEVKEAKDRLDDAIQATQCALDQGIVVGGGCALLYASQKLSEVKLDSFDQMHGVKVLQKAL